MDLLGHMVAVEVDSLRDDHSSWLVPVEGPAVMHIDVAVNSDEASSPVSLGSSWIVSPSSLLVL
jgi:hypothetical protein